MDRLALILLACIIPATGFSQYGNVGNGYSNTSGQGNGMGNGQANGMTVTIKSGKDCILCFSFSNGSVQKKKWHPPLAYPTK